MSTVMKSAGPTPAVLGELHHRWGWLLALGILEIVLGLIGLGIVVELTLASVIVFGVFLVIAAGARVVQVFRAKGWKSAAIQIIIALLYLAAGAIMIYDPVGATLSLTLLLAAMFLAVGVTRLIIAFQNREVTGWGWLLMGGILSLILALLIFLGWPASAFWVIGTFISLDLLMSGWAFLFLALAIKKAKG